MLIVMYHYVRDLIGSRYPNIKGLEVSDFLKQIYFLKNNYNIITMQELIAAIHENQKLPINAALLTFDDGYRDHFDYVFPILHNLGIQGSFFPVPNAMHNQVLLNVNKIHFILASTAASKIIKEIFSLLDHYRGKEFPLLPNEELWMKLANPSRFDTPEVVFIKRLLQVELDETLRTFIASDLFSKFVGVNEKTFAKELYLSEEQIKSMKKSGMYIGIHGFNHYWLGKEDITIVEKDIKDALDIFNGIVDKDSWVMNYPYGSYNDQVIKYLLVQNCKLGLTTNLGIANINTDHYMLLPRLDTNDLPPKSNNYSQY